MSGDLVEAAPRRSSGDGGAPHWLVRVVEQAGMVDLERPELARDVKARDAWAVVSRAYGIPETPLVRLVAEHFRLRTADFRSADPNATLVLSEAMARKYHVFPVFEDDRHLVVATCDPTDVDAERALAFSTGRATVFEVASPTAIQRALDKRFPMDAVVRGGRLADGLGDEAAEHDPPALTEDDASATPVVKLTNLVVRDAIQLGASDIHVEPGRELGCVRYRVDGVLRKHMDLPMPAVDRVIARLKALSRLDIADRSRRQEGRARVRVQSAAYDLRVATIPVAGAERCVVRISDPREPKSLDQLDLPALELDRLRSLLTNRDGVVIVTGPAGSGKTATLYGALLEMAEAKVKVMSVEDPIEHELPGVLQTQVDRERGMTVASGLRSVLPRGPDVLLVGEIRDRETLTAVAKEATGGRLILATVRADDAVGSVERLGELGVPFEVLARVLRGVVAQRLLRRVCMACADPVRGRLTPDERRLTERHGVEPMVRAVGCPECGFTGYRGRVPSVEVLVAGPRIGQAIGAGKGRRVLGRLAVQGGMRSLHEVGLEWVRMGRTTLAEVERVLGPARSDEVRDGPAGSPRVLLVSDDPDARARVRALLEEDGCEVDEAASGAVALDLLEGDSDFHLAVLDSMGPGLDGREVLAHIRGNADTAALPVLMRAGDGSSRLETELLEAGADEYVSASADPERFMARVRGLLRRALP